MESSVQCDFRREFPSSAPANGDVSPQRRPLHIFEPRYRQMLDDALDRVGQLVTATTHPDAEEERPGEPSPLLPVGCIGQIVDHERLPDGRYNILLQGLCRVEIEELNEATDERLYRLGRLSPMVDTEAAQHDRPEEARDLIRIALQGPGVGRMSMADELQNLLDREEAPLDAIVDLLAHPLLRENPDRSEYLSPLHSSGTHGVVSLDDASHQRGGSTTDGRSGVGSTGSRELMPPTWGLNLCEQPIFNIPEQLKS